jgi:hypothetical protein
VGSPNRAGRRAPAGWAGGASWPWYRGRTDTQVGDPRGDRTAHHLALAEEIAEDLVSAAREAALERFERERAGLDEALARLVERDEADGAERMLRALRDVWWQSGRLGEARRWGEAVLAMPSVRAHDAVRATMLDFAGAVAYGQEDHAAARRHFEDSLTLRRSLGDPARVAQSLNHAGRFFGAFAVFLLSGRKP